MPVFGKSVPRFGTTPIKGLIGIIPSPKQPISDVLLAMGYNAVTSVWDMLKGRYISRMLINTYRESAKLLLIELGEQGVSQFYGWDENTNVEANGSNPMDDTTEIRPLTAGISKLGGSLGQGSGIMLQSAPPISTQVPTGTGWQNRFLYRGEPSIPAKLVIGGRTYWLKVFKERVDNNGSSIEWLEISTLGTGVGLWTPLQSFVNAKMDKPKTTSIIYSSFGNSWVRLNEVGFRDPNTLILDNPSTESIVDDIKDFYSVSKPRYKRTGTPWRRGYLLKGVKGSGKSSLIMVMASAIESDVYVINCEGCADNDLIFLFSNLPTKAIVVFEDVDVIAGLTLERASDPSQTGKVSLSTLLNVLDGIYAKEGVVVIMTTNHPEVLDEALVREGRMDVTIEFKPLTYRQFAGMWELHYPESEWDGATSARVVRLGWVSSKLQGILQRFPDDPVGAQKAIWEDLPGDEGFDDMTDPFAEDTEDIPSPQDLEYLRGDLGDDSPIQTHCHACGEGVGEGIEYCASCRYGYR